MELFVLSYRDYMYPEDNYVAGVFATYEEAEARITSIVDYHLNQDGPANHHSKEYNYMIESVWPSGKLAKILDEYDV